MPQAPGRACAQPGCAAVVRGGRYCPAHQQADRQYDQERGSADSRGYDTRWRRLRLMVLRESPLCVDPFHLHAGPGGEVYDGHQRLSVLKAAYGPAHEVLALQSSRPLTEREREELTIAAHTGTTGQFDWDALSGWDAGDLQAWGFDAELLRDWNTGAAALATMLGSEIELPDSKPQQDPELASECFVEIYCSQDDLNAFSQTLSEWALKDGVTVNIS